MKFKTYFTGYDPFYTRLKKILSGLIPILSEIVSIEKEICVFFFPISDENASKNL